MGAAAQDDAAQGRYISKVPAPRGRHVISSDPRIVCRIQLQPAEGRCVYGHPGVRCTPSDKRIGADEYLPNVPADVACGEPAGPQARNHQMCEILTDTAT